jgi:hypothetical protein
VARKGSSLFSVECSAAKAGLNIQGMKMAAQNEWPSAQKVFLLFSGDNQIFIRPFLHKEQKGRR